MMFKIKFSKYSYANHNYLRASVIKLNKEQQDIKNDVRNFLVMKNGNGTARA